MHGIRHRNYSGNEFVDGQGVHVTTLYCATAVAAGEVRIIEYDGVYGEKAVTPTGAMAFNVDTVVALEAVAAGNIGLFAKGGAIVEAKVATGVAVGDHLELIADGTNYITDGTSGSTARSVRTAAIAMEANASGVVALKKVYKYKVPHQIAAS